MLPEIRRRNDNSLKGSLYGKSHLHTIWIWTIADGYNIKNIDSSISIEINSCTTARGSIGQRYRLTIFSANFSSSRE
ncbi:MAG: hypothetical protein R2771_00715 [Saprospiraceae bacterium]